MFLPKKCIYFMSYCNEHPVYCTFQSKKDQNSVKYKVDETKFSCLKYVHPNILYINYLYSPLTFKKGEIMYLLFINF